MDEIIIEGEENSNVVYSGVEIDEPDYPGVDTDTDTDNNEPPVVDSGDDDFPGIDLPDIPGWNTDDDSDNDTDDDGAPTVDIDEPDHSGVDTDSDSDVDTDVDSDTDTDTDVDIDEPDYSDTDTDIDTDTDTDSGNQSIRDILSGGNGDDTYVFAEGCKDTIIRETSGEDTILLAETRNNNNVVVFYQNNNDLIINYGITHDDGKIIVENYFLDNNNKIEKIQLSNNEYLESTEIDRIIQDINASAAENGMQISSANDITKNDELMQLVASGWQS